MEGTRKDKGEAFKSSERSKDVSSGGTRRSFLSSRKNVYADTRNELVCHGKGYVVAYKSVGSTYVSLVKRKSGEAIEKRSIVLRGYRHTCLGYIHARRCNSIVQISIRAILSFSFIIHFFNFVIRIAL